MDRPAPSPGRRTPPIETSVLANYYPALSELPLEWALEVQRRSRTFRAAPGSEAFSEDSPCLGLSLLTRGTIRVHRVSPEGREILLYRVRPGGLCILTVSCLLGGTTYPARATIEHEVEGSLLPAELFDVLIHQVSEFRRFVFGVFRDRITDLMELVEEVAFYHLDQRLAALLLARLAETDRPTLVVTHQDLASQLGSVREMVSRILETFEERGAIRRARREITILRPDLLRDIAGPASLTPHHRRDP